MALPDDVVAVSVFDDRLELRQLVVGDDDVAERVGTDPLVLADGDLEPRSCVLPPLVAGACDVAAVPLLAHDEVGLVVFDDIPLAAMSRGDGEGGAVFANVLVLLRGEQARFFSSCEITTSACPRGPVRYTSG